ncbi:MAG: FprA family A-type flavoprotein [Bacteroidota bacterium]
MKNDQILDVTKDVKWIGILDYDIRKFDIVMNTEFGTTYNSYFINSEKKAIIETSKEKFKDEYLQKIIQITNPADIEYIILNHTEPDHSGNLKHLLKIAPKAKVVGSGNAIRYLKDMIEKPFESIQVKDGDELDLGNKTLRFISAPNLHWPDSTYAYLVEDKLLFTCDSFGAHFCHEEMFDDKVGNYDESFKYYFDVILKPFSKFMLKAIEKIKNLEISAICPGHGPILQNDWKKYVNWSEELAKNYLASSQSSKKRVLIAYVSAYGFTREMAEQIAIGIQEVSDAEIEIADIEEMEMGEIDSKLTLCNALIIGSPTINQNILLPTYKMFALINPIRDNGKLAASFGSYGWSGEGVKIIDSALKSLKLEVPFDGISIKFKSNSTDIKRLIEFGKQFGEKLNSSDSCNS